MSSEVTSRNQEEPRRRLRLAPLDYLAIIAGIINALVIGYIVVTWFQNQ